MLGNQSGGGILSKDQLYVLRQLCKDDDKYYSDRFYQYQYLDRLLYDNNIYTCDIPECDKVFFDVKNLRKHVLEAHADEGLRKIATSSDPRM